eukprot:Nk52_evm1s2144 gene=Nk52_evmTU1s2144
MLGGLGVIIISWCKKKECDKMRLFRELRLLGIPIVLFFGILSVHMNGGVNGYIAEVDSAFPQYEDNPGDFLFNISNVPCLTEEEVQDWDWYDASVKSDVYKEL